MMFNKMNTTVIICCAGMGTRLGIGTTKALLMIDQKPLIMRQLDMLEGFDDIRVVVGFRALQLIEKINEQRKDIMFAFNYSYQTTGPAASVSKALLGARENVIILDGDLLIHPDDFKMFLNEQDECIAITRAYSREPVWIETQGAQVVDFSKEKQEFEWTGIIKTKKNKLPMMNSFVYEMIRPILPINAKIVRVVDIDTIDDYELACEWMKNQYGGKLEE